MSHRRANPPILLPGEAWTLLSVVAALFAISGVFTLCGLLVVFAGKALDWSLVREMVVSPVAVGISTMVAAAHLWIASLLRQARRLGGYIAAASFGLSLAAPWFGSDAPRPGDFLVPVLSLIAIALCWRHLTPEGSAREPHTSIASRHSD